MTLDAEGLRAAMRAWTSGVVVVAAAHNGEWHGMTVSSFTSISLDPALIIISLQAASRTHELVGQAGAFAVTILSADQKMISERFAGRTDDGDRFDGLETETLETGAPFLKGGLAYLDCRVTQSIPSGMNTLFLAEVVAARGEVSGQPLVYHDRQYHVFKD